MWHWCKCQWHQITKKSCCTSSIIQTQGIQCCNIWCHWHHVMPTPVPMFHHVILKLVPMASYDEKVMLHLLQSSWPKKCGIVPLMTLLSWCDNDMSINDITRPKELCCTSFWLFDDTIDFIWYWCWCKWHHMTKKSCCISFDYLDITNGMVPFMTLLA